jgi:hypothetical protein
MNTFNRPEMTEERIITIRKLIEENPGMGRSKLSVMLCNLWNWRGANGRTKDMSCRDMLRALDKAGKIKLPKPQRAGRKAGEKLVVKHLTHDETSVTGSLKELRPLQVKVVSSKSDLEQFKSYIDQYHYLRFDRYIGERMAYMVYSRNGVVLSCLLFGSAAWSCKERDLYIGWGKEQRRQRINFLTNNVRFLVLPWVKVPHLASHMLSLITKRISTDWEYKYGHPILAVETFIETGRFRGVCYRAANWTCVGSTTGRGRNGGHHNSILPVKEIYLYPLDKNYRSKLCK